MQNTLRLPEAEYPPQIPGNRNFIPQYPNGDILGAQLAYWKQQLTGASTILELPTDHPRPAVNSHHNSNYTFVLSRQLTDDLKALSRREGVNLFITLTAAFNILLHRYTGQDDLLIGTDTMSYRHPETERSLDIFSNVLPLRTNLSGNPTFRELLARVQTVILDAEAHQDVPFEYLLKELQLEGESGQNPLFQVMLTIQPSVPDLSSDWALTQTDVNIDRCKLDLSLIFEDQLEGLIVRFEFNIDLFDETTIARMSGHLQTLLKGIVDNPSQRISELPILTQAERHQLLVERNATQVAYPRDTCLPQLIEDQVERTPDAVAVVYKDTQLTYRELNARANQLAHYLRQLGVGPDALVGLYVERSLEMVVGLLGILKAGGAYVPLDPTYPDERIAFMLTDAQAHVLVTQQHLTAYLPAHSAQVVCLDADAPIVAQQSETNPVPVATSDNLAYVIYTSGSTGRPKGVQILHRALVNFLISMRQQPGLTAEDVLLAVTTLSFDIAALELFLPLIVGAHIVMASRDVVANGAALAELLESSRATVMQAAPVTWRILLAAGWQGNPRLKILCGGEALPRELARQLLAKVGSLWNMYGPTETTIWSTVCKIEPADETISIGCPIANTSLYLLDTHLQLVPDGVPGELYIGGDGLARGYLYRPELTAERFISHPFSDESGARLYKTGDLARYLTNGTIEHLGRLDFQVKLRGYRIELGEIEAILSQHPSVQQAVVIVREDVPGDKRLVAYVIPNQEQTATISDLQKHAMKQLPSYMVPSVIVLLETLPLTPNGKVDRKALPAPDSSRTLAPDTFVAPTLPIHHQLIQLWEELLDVRPIGIRDNFFYLGGHSLLAARFVARVEEVFGKKLSLATLFACPTIEQLAHALQTGEEKSSHTPLVAIQVSGSQRPFFYLHGAWEGDAFYCFHLAQHLGPDQPFYALAPYNFDSVQDVPTIEEMAKAHISSLRAIQLEGPYLLGGFCNGGLVAYEMARQLHAQGQQVDRLILIEPAYPPLLHALARGLIPRVGNLLRLSQRKQLDYFLRLRHIYKFLRRERKLEDLKGFRSIDPSIHSLFPTAYALRQDDNALFDWIISGYNYDPYPSKITLIWADEEPFRGIWQRKTTQEKGIELHIIPGNHIACRTDHIRAMAEELYRSLYS